MIYISYAKIFLKIYKYDSVQKCIRFILSLLIYILLREQSLDGFSIVRSPDDHEDQAMNTCNSKWRSMARPANGPISSRRDKTWLAI